MSPYTMSQTSMNSPKVMPSYSNLWKACIINLCHPHLIQMQRCPAPPMPAPLSVTTTSCSPLHPKTSSWTPHPQTTSPSEESNQVTICHIEKPLTSSTKHQALLQPREEDLTVAATTPPTPALHHHQTSSCLLPNIAASAVGDTRWHSRPGTPCPLQMEEPILIVHNLHWACSLPASPQRDLPLLRIFPLMMPPHQGDTINHPLVRTPCHQLKPQNPSYWEASKNL